MYKDVCMHCAFSIICMCVSVCESLFVCTLLRINFVHLTTRRQAEVWGLKQFEEMSPRAGEAQGARAEAQGAQRWGSA